jgi:hypothetical protein
LQEILIAIDASASDWTRENKYLASPAAWLEEEGGITSEDTNDDDVH